MDTLAIAFGAVSPLGDGENALSSFREYAAAQSVVRVDPLLRAAGLPRTAAARVDALERNAWTAEQILLRALGPCVEQLSQILPAWRSQRIGVAIGTSSGGMPATELALRQMSMGQDPAPNVIRSATYGAPLQKLLETLAVPTTRSLNVLAACASSTFALGIGHLWLTQNVCDVVLAGGYDALSVFVGAGFSSLGAITQTIPQPFRRDRDGLAVGEGAAIVALIRAEANSIVPPLFAIGGFGASTDAVHLTAPDRRGAGVVRAVRRALAAANERASAIDIVSAHGTATRFNDAAEALALKTLLGSRVERVPVHAMKGEIGHTFGAAGVLEALTIGRALRVGLVPASVGGEGPVDPDAWVGVSNTTQRVAATNALKISSAFGGANAALLLRKNAKTGVQRSLLKRKEKVALLATATAFSGEPLPRLASRLGLSIERLARTDAISRATLAAVAELATCVGRTTIMNAGLIVGHTLATASTNEIFYRRLLQRGAAAVEARRFPATSPNACVGETAIAFRMRGPTLAVGGQPGTPSGAWQLAHDLIACEWLSTAVVVEVSPGQSSFVNALCQAVGGSALESTRADAWLLIADGTGKKVRPGPLPGDRFAKES